MRQNGFTLLELLVTLSLAFILGGIAIPQMMQFNSASQNAAALVESFSKQVRARAIASTSAYRMKPSGSGTLITEYANTCSSATWTADLKNRLYLPNNTYLVGTEWDICFNSRGLPDGNLEIDVREQTGGTKTVEIMLGGGDQDYMRNAQSGFSLVEVLVALGIFAVVTAIMAPSFLYQLSTNTKAELKNGAIAVTQQVLDGLRPLEVSSLPTSGITTQNISAGDRTYLVKTLYCVNSAWCGTSSRHIRLEIYYRNNKVYGTETIFSQLR